MKLFFTLILSISIISSSIAQSCTVVIPATGGTCPGSTSALDREVVTTGTTTYITDHQQFSNYTIDNGGKLVVCDGGILEISNFNINGGTLYISGNGRVTIGNCNGNARKITNYGTLIFSGYLNTADNDEYYNAGNFIASGINFQGNSPKFTNVTTGVVTVSGNSVNINTGGIVNNGSITVEYFTINNGGLCMGNAAVLSCVNFNNNALDAITVSSGTAGIIVSGNANNNQRVTNTSNTLNVAIAGTNGFSNWGTSSVQTSTTTLPPATTVTPTQFFTKATGSLHTLSTWGANIDGTGTNPTDFTGARNIYVIRNRTTADISADWTISGANSILSIGDSIAAADFTVSGGDFDFTGLLIITSKSSLNVSPSRTMTFKPGSALWITSSGYGEGALGPILGTLTGLSSGNVTVDQYIPAKASRKWSFLASPIEAGHIFNNWQHQIHVTGPLTNGIVCTNALPSSQIVFNTDNGLDPTETGNYSMYYFDPTAVAGTGTQWKPVTATDNNNDTFQLKRGNGFRVLVRGPRSLGCSLVGTNAFGVTIPPPEVTLQSYGNIANITNGNNFTLPYSAANGNKFVMIGNPYPAILNFAAFQTTNSSLISNKYWLYSPENASGTYSTYASGVLSNRSSNYPANGSQDNLLSTWQSFIIELATSGSGNLTFSESHKFISSTFLGTFGVNGPIKNVLHLNLQTTAGNNLDGIAIRFTDDSKVTNSNYTDYDATSLNDGATQYLQTIKGDKMMAIQGRKLSFINDTVAVNAVSRTSGNFKLNATGIESFTNTNIYLIDKFTGTKQLLNHNPEYIFSVDKNDATTFGANRFQVVFEKKTTAIINTILNSYKAYPSPVINQLTVELPGIDQKYGVRILSVTGSAVYSKQINSGINSINTKDFMSGIYLLEITDAQGNRNIQKIVKFN